ncbi:MAG: hypothetical protein HY553_08420 [Elusimicrobia bacterium]|nr:hypothetical protein [Elusimicrobiota bacterium]
MLSELQRKRVWEGWFKGEVRANYFADLSGRYRRRQRTATWLTLLLSSGAFGTLLAQLPPRYGFAPMLLAALTAAVSLWSLVAQNQQHAVDAADLHHRWNRLASDYRYLWDEMYAEDAIARLAILDERAADLSKAGTAFPVRGRLIAKWHRHVKEQYTAPVPA